MNKKTIIGRVTATEKYPTTIDYFYFWTNIETKLNAFDIIKVERENSSTYGVIESLSHITDAPSFLTNFISCDFGNTEISEATYRVGMNFAQARVIYNSHNDYTPVHNNSKVYLADEIEITSALGLDRIENKLPCGILSMYEGTSDQITIPVNLNYQFLLGHEGAHLNISGISGLAAKTSFAMFLLKSIQNFTQSDENGVGFLIFNVKGKDLMAIDCPNLDLSKEDIDKYKALEIAPSPFSNVKYFIPYNNEYSKTSSSYLTKEEIESYINQQKLKKFKYTFSDDKESIEMMFANVDDPNYTMESIISKIIDEDDSDFSGEKTWDNLKDKLKELSQRGGQQKSDISVLSWRKFKRIINKSLNHDMFANRIKEPVECRLADQLKYLKNGDVFVIDIAKLPEDKQSFVFGDALKTIYNIKLGEYDSDDNVNPPSKIIIFIDELNKYASLDTPKNSPILRQILDITERGRSLGVILFGAEQFRSAIHKRVTGNCATHAYGRTNSIETSTADYRSIPEVFRNMLTRLNQGEYLIQNPIFRSLLKIQFPKPLYKQFK